MTISVAIRSLTVDVAVTIRIIVILFVSVYFDPYIIQELRKFIQLYYDQMGTRYAEQLF